MRKKKWLRHTERGFRKDEKNTKTLKSTERERDWNSGLTTVSQPVEECDDRKDHVRRVNDNNDFKNIFDKQQWQQKYTEDQKRRVYSSQFW